ncbi:hypothetical protein HC766_04865 [Candidatus Gracilibacteria bacterium]|nr:hypothetical protein [Candidatus Gracilibacteria bacterium]
MFDSKRSQTKILKVSNKTNKTKKISYETEQTSLLDYKKPVELVLKKSEKKSIQLPINTKKVNVEVNKEEY